MAKRDDLPVESDWEELCSFDFAVEELLSIPDFIQNVECLANEFKVQSPKFT